MASPFVYTNMINESCNLFNASAGSVWMTVSLVYTVPA
jgi:hypothetical protein